MYKIGLIGCGRISNMHFSSIENIEEFSIHAICDIKEDVMKEYSEKYQCSGYTNYKKMIDQEDLDLIVIAAPNGLHYEMGMYAIERNKHILMEKPVALNSEQAQDLIDFAHKRGVYFFAVKQVRYNPSIQVLKQYLDRGALGKIFSINLTVNWTRPQAYYDQSDWRGTLDMDGGTLLNQGIHYIDIMQWYVGDTKQVFGKIDTIAHKMEIEDEAFALIEFKNGAFGTINVNMNTYPRNVECSITVLGTTGSVKLSGSAMNKIEFWEVKDIPEPQVQEGFSPNVYAGGLYQGSCPNHIFVYQDILELLKNGKGHYISGEDALPSIKIVDAVYKSSKENKPITIK